MGFEDMFQDVKFDDAKISLSDATPGQDAGNSGTPAPDDKGQSAATPPATADQKAATSEPDKDQGDQSQKDEGTPKPPPYDQDPKWKKARAAEKALDDLLQEHGLLDVEELKAKLLETAELKKHLGKRDLKKTLDDADYADKVKQNWEKQKREEMLSQETPDKTIERLERENEDLKRSFEEFKTTSMDREHARQVISTFETEVNKVIGTLENPLPDHEREILNLVLGVKNPVNEIDIEDVTAVRKMTREGISRFQTAIQKIKQSAIDEYVAGKSKLAVDTSKGAPASVGQGVGRQPLKKDATFNDTMDDAKKEYFEVLMQGLKAAS